MTDLKSFLLGLGLSEKEVELYLCSLRCGTQTASTLAKKIDIPRSTINFLFDQLIHKGFATKEVREKTTYFRVIEPETIEYVLLQKSMETKKQLSDFKEVLPLLNQLKNKNSLATKVTYYEGLESLYRIIDHSCEKDEPVLFISSHINMHPKVREYIEEVYTPRSKKHSHKNKMILSDGEKTRDYLKKAEGVYDEVLVVDPKSNPFKLTLAIHGNSVDFVSYDSQGLSGVIIENPLIADHMRTIFELVKKHFEN